MSTAASRPLPLSLGELASLSDDELNRALRGSSMRRAKAAGLRRNIEIAKRNAGGT